MALKITGRTPTARRERLTVTQRGSAPSEAREIAMQCDLCQKRCYAMLPFQPTREQRLELMRAAMEEHRRLCPVGAPESRRTYTLLYAR